jgi:hypothetical protein
MMEDEGAQQGIARSTGLLTLYNNIRYNTVTQIPPAFHDRCDLRIVPGLALAGTVITHVRGEDTELRPSDIDLLIDG